MINTLKAFSACSLLLTFTASVNAAIVNYEVIGYADPFGVTGLGAPIFNIDGSSNGTDVESPTNYQLVSNGSYVDFLMGDADNGSALAAYLRVTVDNLSQTGESNAAQLMLVRTSDSQGLTDTGTITLHLDSANRNDTFSGSVTFDWYGTAGGPPNAAADNVTPLANEYTITSYDLDIKQRNSMSTSLLQSTTLSDDTVLEISESGGLTRVADTGNTNSTVGESSNAVIFRTNTSSSQTLYYDKFDGSAGGMLYMFEFRNPPANLDTPIPVPETTPIPEVSALNLAAVSILTFFIFRRPRRG